MYGELSRFPVLHNAWALAIKYWRRLCIGTRNVLLNECFEMCTQENHDWLQSIFYVWMTLEMPGLFLYILVRIFKQRLNDKFIQEWKSNVLSSKIFTLLSTLFKRYEMSTYITAVKNPDIRNIYTGLRIDMNVLSTSRSCKNMEDMCPLRGTEPETVSHFIFKCPQVSYLRGKFCDNVSSHSPDSKDKNEITQLKYPLDFDVYRFKGRIMLNEICYYLLLCILVMGFLFCVVFPCC